MASLARSARLASRAQASRRAYSVVVDAPPAQWVAKREEIKAHAKGTTQLWRRICFFVCVPGTVATILWVRNVEAEHAAHIEHEKHENGGNLPEIPAYEYLNKRQKPFPWGMNSLFYNPAVNKNMEESE
ncbi:unnamed protein product [Peniophora sp. CBMAI 1063]|nr:unnamed protein product [Peniophora sp. CBMAI 1063]